MHISTKGLRLIESFEGWSSTPYWDAYGHVWTRGYGETEGIGPHSPTLTRAQGEQNLRRLVITRYEPSIRALGVLLNQNQWDALCSFVWNLGPGILDGQLGNLLREHKIIEFANAMLAYDHAGGAVLAGLKSRRERERALFLTTATVEYVPAQERNWITEWDRLRGRRTPAAHVRRLFLRAQMMKRCELIQRLAASDAPDGWRKLDRRARYDALRARTD